MGNRLGIQFPVHFKSEVPENTVILAVTAICFFSLFDLYVINRTFPQIACCLDELELGYLEKKAFTTAAYNAIYERFVNLVKKLNKDKYHSPKFIDTCKDCDQKW